MIIFGRFLAVLFFCAIFSVIVVNLALGQNDDVDKKKPGVQTLCPVMVDQEIDPELFSEYKGKKVFFCCEMCKGIFEGDPERYLDRLPQFAVEQEVSSEKPSIKMRLVGVIKPLGIATLVSLIVTFFLGWRIKRNRKLHLPIHLIFASLTVFLGVSHALLIYFLF